MAEASENTIELVKDTLTGDVAAFLVDRLRNLEVAYRYMNEEMQRDVISDANRAAENLVDQAVRIIAQDGRDVIPVRVKKVENDGSEIKVTIIGATSDEHRHSLFDAAGAYAYLSISDSEQYKGGEGPQPDPDQGDMIQEAAE